MRDFWRWQQDFWKFQKYMLIKPAKEKPMRL